MEQGVPSKLIAACMGSGGFAVAMVAGIAADNPLDVVLSRGLVALAGCYAAGLVAGGFGERIIRERNAGVRQAPGGASPGGAGNLNAKPGRSGEDGVIPAVSTV